MGLHTHMMGDEGLAFYNTYFGQLVGAKIIGFEMTRDTDFGEFWPTFTAVLKDGTEVTLELSQDEEGNGPGFIFGLPSVQMKEES